MKSSRAQRWDLVVGAFASLVAIAGLLLSIALGNTASVGFGFLHPDTQKFMAALAGVFLVLVAIKAGIRYRSESQAVCAWSVERFASAVENETTHPAGDKRSRGGVYPRRHPLLKWS